VRRISHSVMNEIWNMTTMKTFNSAYLPEPFGPKTNSERCRGECLPFPILWLSLGVPKTSTWLFWIQKIDKLWQAVPWLKQRFQGLENVATSWTIGPMDLCHKPGNMVPALPHNDQVQNMHNSVGFPEHRDLRMLTCWKWVGFSIKSLVHEAQKFDSTA
jgi:hypothetical protein